MTIRRHGPKKRRTIVEELLINLLESDYFDNWRTADEVGRKISKGISPFWTQVNSRSAGAMMRRYQKKYNLKLRFDNSINHWKFAESSGETTEDKASAHKERRTS